MNTKSAKLTAITAITVIPQRPRLAAMSACVLLLAALMAMLPRAQAADVRYTSVELPLVDGWFQGRVVQYVTIDASTPEKSADAGANWVPKLANALPAQPRLPGQPTSLDRIYGVTNFKQPSILPSIPLPTGPKNADRSYSPLWQIHKVTWKAGVTPYELTSEEAVLDAEEKKLLTIEATNIVANCPVVYSAVGGVLPGAKMLGPKN